METLVVNGFLEFHLIILIPARFGGPSNNDDKFVHIIGPLRLDLGGLDVLE